MTFHIFGTPCICAVEDITDKSYIDFGNPFKEVKNFLERFFPTDLANIILIFGLQSPSAMVIKNRIFELNGLSVIDPSVFRYHNKVEQFMKRCIIIDCSELLWKAESFV